jgi:hypothetical protein
MQDVADAVLAQLPATEPLGYRLLIQRTWPTKETIFEAVAVTALGTTAYMARYCFEMPILPVSEWRTVVARDERALKALFRLTMRERFMDSPAVVLVAPSEGAPGGSDLQFCSHCWDLGGDPNMDHPVGSHAERVLADAVAALGLLKGPSHGPYAWG